MRAETRGLIHTIASVAVASVLPVGGGRLASAQTAVAHAPDRVTALIVEVETRFDTSASAPQTFGAGIVVGSRNGAMYVVTARHVLFSGGHPAVTMRVGFEGKPSNLVEATVEETSVSLDLAVLRVPGALSALGTSQDWIGDTRALRFGDPVVPLGCPNGVCWRPPPAPGRFSGIDREGIFFQTDAVREGNSGGALLNQWSEVVGMVTNVAPPLASALPIDVVLDQARQWKVPVSLHRASVPRGGYRTTVGLVVLGPTSRPRLTQVGSRWPSVRITVARQLGPWLSLDAGALRLSADNVIGSAGTAGVHIGLHRQHFAIGVFADVGVAQVIGRYDLGGYYSASGTGTVYVPVWSRVRTDGFGVGGGVDARFTVVPHLAIEALVGHWSFPTPQGAPTLPNLYVGLGLAWGF